MYNHQEIIFFFHNVPLTVCLAFAFTCILLLDGMSGACLLMLLIFLLSACGFPTGHGLNITKDCCIPNLCFFFFTNCQVRGDETLVLQSVLECDTEREKLLEEEKKLLSLTGHGRYIAFNYYRGIE